MKCRPKMPYDFHCIQWNGNNYDDIVKFLGYEPEVQFLNVLMITVMKGASSVLRGVDLDGWILLYKNSSPLDAEIIAWHDFENMYEVETTKPKERCR